MKANEILARQDRAVYILMVLIASLGLLWSFWQRQHRPEDTLARPPHTQSAAAHQATVFKR